MFDIRVYFHFFDRAVDLVEPEAQVPVAPLPNRQEVEGSHGWSNFCHAGFWEFLLRESFCQAQVFITVFFAIVAFVILAFA